jgi:adenine-specific DNA-methyltransferase
MSCYSCEICGKSFQNKSSYQTHMNRKTPCIKNLENINKNELPLKSDELPLKSDEHPLTHEIHTMRYLGNKTRCLDMIFSTIQTCLSKMQMREEEEAVIFDAFGGTGAVTQFLNWKKFSVISNDINDYSFRLCFSRNSILSSDLTFDNLQMTMKDVLAKLNTCKKKGFVYYNYSPNPELPFERKYFTNENAEKIDGIRTQIEEWYQEKKITEKEYHFLVALLIETVSLYSNIPGTYGAFNTNWDSRAIRSLELVPEMAEKLFAQTPNGKTFHADIRDIISDIDCDILYLDPPYNERDYSMYYHVLETISLYNSPELNINKTNILINKLSNYNI